MKIQTNNMRKHSQVIPAFNDKLSVKQNFYKQNQNENNTHRPAQAISFGGSAVSMIENAGSKAALGAWHKLIDFVYDNEAAYNAIYALIVAGMLKPFFVLRMKGSEEKDKQIVATKNFLQAFIGFVLTYTIGGGLVKKAVDVIKNNKDLTPLNKAETAFKVTDDAKLLEKLAKNSLKKDKSGFLTKFRFAKDEQGKGVLATAWDALTKKAVIAENKPKDFNPDKQIFVKITQNDIADRISDMLKTAEAHLPIYNNPKFFEYFKRLRMNGDEKALLAQKDSLLNLVKSNAPKADIEANYKSLVSLITDNSAANYKKEIAEKANELKGKLDKENIQSALDELFKFVKDKGAHETLMETYDSVWKNSSGSVTAIAKAMIASALLPTVMGFLFAKRNAQKKREEEAKKSAVLLNSPMYKKEQENFKAVTDKGNKANNNQVAFTGGMNKVIDKFAMGVEWISATKFGQGLVNTIHNLPKPLNKTSARMGDLESFLITGYWVQNTLRSKRIDPEQKLGLNVHTVLVTAVSSVCALLIDTLLDSLITSSKDKYTQKLTDAALKAVKSDNMAETLSEGCKNLLGGKNAAQQISEVLKNSTSEFFENGNLIKDSGLDKAIQSLTNSYGKKLIKFKSLTIFTLVVRFLVPVLMVPFSGKLKKHIQKMQQEKKLNSENKNKTEVKK